MGWNGVFGNPCLWAFLVADARKSPLQPNIHLLPQALQATVFDMQVNAGGNAIKILQRLLGQFQAPVSVDGALGPYTATAVQRIYNRLEPIWWTPHSLTEIRPNPPGREGWLDQTS
jgi:hypothetical protein